MRTLFSTRGRKLSHPRREKGGKRDARAGGAEKRRKTAWEKPVEKTLKKARKKFVRRAAGAAPRPYQHMETPKGVSNQTGSDPMK